jgi:serine phosphatase RsbU (regulator of sigma subunit)/anti-sigma regulatory factor (Ser/Thr protein kinase)
VPNSPDTLSVSWTKSLPCDLSAVRDATVQFCGFLREQGLGTEEIGAWELLCAEAGNNAVQYARPAAAHIPIVLIARVSATEAELQVVDHTAGFEFPENPQLPDDLSEHGRGLFLMRTLSDRVDYLRGRDENRLILGRHRQSTGIPRPAPTAQSAEAAANEALVQSMSEELAACYESLSAIFRFTAEINKGSQDSRFIRHWLDQLRAVCGADWWVLRLADPGTTTLAQFASSRTDLLAPVSLDASQDDSVEAQAALGRQDVWLEPTATLHADDPLRQIGSSLSGLCHPIYVNAVPLGVLSIGCAESAEPFKAGEVSIIHTFADFLGIQIHNAWIQAEQLRSRLVSRDLEIAATIQRSLLPERLPAPAGFRLAGHSASASQVGGDFFDVLELPDEGLLLAIADVMGKGVSAAMFAAIFRSHLRSRPELASTPGAFLTWLNRALFEDLDRVDMFVTAQLVYLNLRRRELRVASAGHCPLLLGGRHEPVRDLGADGPPLGITAEAAWTEQHLLLPEDPRLVMFTDGLIEVRNRTGAFLGLEPVKACLNLAIQNAESADDIRKALQTLVADFQGGQAATDDLTFLIFASDSTALNS